MAPRRSFSLLILLLLGVLALESTLIRSRAALARTRADIPGIRPYASLSGNARLQPLDPRTLTDDNSVRPLLYRSPRWGWNSTGIVADPSGATFAAIHQAHAGAAGARDITIRVFRSSGAARGPAFHPAVYLSVDGLSTGGSQLYGYGYGSGEFNGPTTGYYVISARTGALLHHVPLHQMCCLPTLYDPIHGRLYVLHESQSGYFGQPESPVLVAYDLVAGRKIGSLRLPGVLAGVWSQGADRHGYLFVQGYDPGFALRPDGKMLALLDGHRDKLIVIDASTLTVVHVLQVKRPASLWDRVGAWLGLIPEQAFAKELYGVSLQMSFSPDGRSLMVMGGQGKQNRRGKYVYSSLDLRLIDVASGEIRAEQPARGSMWWSAFTPDGSVVYTLETSPQFGPYVLRRYDAGSLRLGASRVFFGRQLMGVLVLRGQ
jgi:hypothetical protein